MVGEASFASDEARLEGQVLQALAVGDVFAAGHSDQQLCEFPFAVMRSIERHPAKAVSI